MRRIAAAVTATVFTIGLVVAVPAVANADQMYWTGGSPAKCEQVQRSYISSWTKITKPCYRSGNGWAFKWTSIR